MTFEDLLNYDREAFVWVNTQATHPRLDQFFIAFTDLHKLKAAVIVGAVLLLGSLFYKFGFNAIKLVVALAIAIGLSDLVSYRLVKKNVERPRPFQSAELKGVARQLTVASGNSFPSNHAANCFAAASILSIYFRRARYLFYILAALVAYSRVYVGVHYPSDVIAGALIGSVCAFVVRIFMVNQYKHWSLDSE